MSKNSWLSFSSSSCLILNVWACTRQLVSSCSDYFWIMFTLFIHIQWTNTHLIFRYKWTQQNHRRTQAQSVQCALWTSYKRVHLFYVFLFFFLFHFMCKVFACLSNLPLSLPFKWDQYVLDHVNANHFHFYFILRNLGCCVNVMRTFVLKTMRG